MTRPRFSLLVIHFVMLAVLAFAASRSSAATRTTTVYLGGMSCSGCASNIEHALKEMPGVKSAVASFEKAEAVVTHDDQLTPEAIVGTVVRAGYSAGLAKDRLTKPDLLDGFDLSKDVKLASAAGEDFDEAAALVPGKVTIVDYFASWCVPCRALDVRLVRLLATEPRAAVRKVNIVEWSSPVARSRIARIEEIPFVRIYGPTGELLAELGGGKGKLDSLETIVTKAVAK